MGGGRRTGAAAVALVALASVVAACGPSPTASPPYPLQPSVIQPQIDELARTPPGVLQSTHPPATPAPRESDVVTGHADATLARLAVPAPRQPAPLPAVPPAPVSVPVGPTAAFPDNRVPADPVNRSLSDILAPIDRAPVLHSVIDPAYAAVTTIDSAITYRVCAQAVGRPLACTVSVPLGVPVLVAAGGGPLPDVVATLAPFVPVSVSVGFMPVTVNLSADLGAIDVLFNVHRLLPAPVKAWVFAVYDPPGTHRRIEYGYDGRASTLAADTTTLVTLGHDISATVTHTAPGRTEAETVALKTLVSHPLQPPVETDGTVGSVQFTPVPSNLTTGVDLRDPTSAVALDASEPTTVEARLLQRSGPSSTNLHVVIDRFPAHVAIRLTRAAGRDDISYTAAAPIAHVHVSGQTIPDIAHPGTYTRTVGDVTRLPASLHFTVQKAEATDVDYAASSVIPAASVVVYSVVDNAIDSVIAAAAERVPKSIHVDVLKTTGPTIQVTYRTDSPLGALILGTYTRQDEQVLRATARDIPTHVVATVTGDAFEYRANAKLGSVEAIWSKDGGATIPMPGVDHVTFRRRGAALGVDARITGIGNVSVTYGNRTYTVDVNTSGEPFQAVVDVDGPRLVATVAVSNLPPHLRVDLDAVTDRVSYIGSTGIRRVDATYAEPDSGLVAGVSLVDIPKTVNVHWTSTGSAPALNYSAGGRLGSIHAFAQWGAGKGAFEAEVDDLPETLNVSGPSPLTVDTGENDHIGRILLRYSSTGELFAASDRYDHLVLALGPSSIGFELVYEGLESASFDHGSSAFHATVSNTAARRFDFDVTANLKPDVLTARGFVDAIPTTVTVDVAGSTFHYKGDRPIAEIALAATLGQNTLEADVRDIPTEIQLKLDSGPEAHWQAAGPTGSIAASAHLGFLSPPVDAALRLTGLPATWDATFGGGGASFTAASTIASITARLSNHRSGKAFDQDGLSYDVNQNGETDAYIQIADLSSFEFDKTTNGFHLNVRAGSGTTERFLVHADVIGSDTGRKLDGEVRSLPSNFDLTQDAGAIAYKGDLHPSANLMFVSGTAAAVARTDERQIPRPYGVALTDASGALAGSLYLDGLPTSLRVQPVDKTYRVAVTGLGPSKPVTADLALGDKKLLATVDFGSGPPVDFTLDPIVITSGRDLPTTVSAHYTASRKTGPVSADVTLGNQVGHVDLSGIPSSVDVHASFGQQFKTVTVDLGEKLASVTALYRRVTDGKWMAGARLTNVPTRTTVNVDLPDEKSIDEAEGAKKDSVAEQKVDTAEAKPTDDTKVDAEEPNKEEPKQDGLDDAELAKPVFDLETSTPGLGLVAFADASIFGGAIQGAVQLVARGLGRSVRATRDGNTIGIESSPATTCFTLVGAIHLPPITIPSTTQQRSGVTAHIEGSIDLNVRQVTIGFEGASKVTIDPGPTIHIDGDYHSFTFAEQSDTKMTIHAFVSVLGIPVRTLDMTNRSIPNAVGYFRLAQPGRGAWIAVAHKCVNLDPLPLYTTDSAAFKVFGPAFVTVNPVGLVPDEVLDLIAAVTRHPANTPILDVHDC